MSESPAKVRSIQPGFNRAWLAPVVIFAGGALALIWSLMTPSWTGDPVSEAPVLTSRVQGSWLSLHDDGWRGRPGPREIVGVDGPADARKRRRSPDHDQKRSKVVVPEPRPEPEMTATYRLKGHDRLWNLAEKFLGDGTQWPKIVARNPGLNPNRLVAGTVIEIPMPDKKGEQGSMNVSERIRHHVVRDNETLYTIAQKYRPRSDWTWLFEANRDVVDHPDRVRAGTRLVIPTES